MQGKITGQRVLDVEGPTMETSVSIEGSFRGTQVKQHMTYISKPVSPGVIHGKAKGVMMAGESECVYGRGNRKAKCNTIFLLSESSQQTNITALPELNFGFAIF
jgi:hypothetical protein